jgi:hypothetical protein
MHIQGQMGATTHSLYHQRPYGYVGNKVAIHYVHVYVVSTRSGHCGNFFSQSSKISRQN